MPALNNKPNKQSRRLSLLEGAKGLHCCPEHLALGVDSPLAQRPGNISRKEAALPIAQGLQMHNTPVGRHTHQYHQSCALPRTHTTVAAVEQWSAWALVMPAPAFKDPLHFR